LGFSAVAVARGKEERLDRVTEKHIWVQKCEKGRFYWKQGEAGGAGERGSIKRRAIEGSRVLIAGKRQVFAVKDRDRVRVDLSERCRRAPFFGSR